MVVSGGTDGRREGRTDAWKFPPVFYRTSALWGRCPKRVRMGSKVVPTDKVYRQSDDSIKGFNKSGRGRGRGERALKDRGVS